MDSTKSISNGVGLRNSLWHYVGNNKSTIYYSGQVIYNLALEDYLDSNSANTKEIRVGKTIQTIGTIPLDSRFYDSIGNFVYLDKGKDSLFTRIYTVYKKYIITAEPPIVFNWKISTTAKQILGYNAYKAATTFRGRNYEAWFSNEIPVLGGPWKFTGLPGLILELYSKDDQVKIIAENVIIGGELIQLQPDLTAERFTLQEYFSYPVLSAKKQLKSQREFFQSMAGPEQRNWTDEEAGILPKHMDGSNINLDALYFIEKRW